jgi:hypothetical protein
MKKFIVILLLLLIIASLAYRIDAQRSPHELIGELMYFPSGFALRAVSMGFYAPLADLVWLRFIQYYGEHRMTDTRFELMYHILDILTTLDTRFLYAYTLGGLMLTHDAQRPDQAGVLLKKGMLENQDDWRFPFVHAFINYVFLKEYRVAQTYFKIAAQKPNAPDRTRRWYAFVTFTKVGDLETSLALWVDLYNTTKNPEEKAIAETYIKSIKMQLDIEYLDEKVAKFSEQYGRVPLNLNELLSAGILKKIPEEPHGESYYIKNGKVYSTLKRGQK